MGPRLVLFALIAVGCGAPSPTETARPPKQSGEARVGERTIRVTAAGRAGDSRIGSAVGR